MISSLKRTWCNLKDFINQETFVNCDHLVIYNLEFQFLQLKRFIKKSFIH